ncbi:MAG: hypothetical protein LBF41_10400, partial [Deltaproteobacteria bacterium]|nr:hypothetical protein [Deltaproteobacteria bacterium]
YAEASFRIGKSTATFSTADFGLVDMTGSDEFVDIGGRFYGLHGGLGYLVVLSEYGNPSSLDLSAKYFYTERKKINTDVLGADVQFAKAQSSRLRAGLRYNYGLTDLITSYAGAYYEREFNGESEVKVGEDTLPVASAAGSVGIAELGVILTSESLPIDFEASLRGFGGERDGIAGSLKLNYSF